ncbi:MAG: hypothetical protein P1Q69_12535 [Candidatus Thorarchaeota archaeon]|nr:hypothetical protein [Candidatus Thorarchaeota archaeon]
MGVGVSTIIKNLVRDRKLLLMMVLIPLIISTTLSVVNETIELSNFDIMEQNLATMPYQFSIRFSATDGNTLPSNRDMENLCLSIETLDIVSNTEILTVFTQTINDATYVYLGVQEDSILWNLIVSNEGVKKPFGNESLLIDTGLTTSEVSLGDELRLQLPPIPDFDEFPSYFVRQISVSGRGVPIFDIENLQLPNVGDSDFTFLLLMSYESFWLEVLSFYHTNTPPPGPSLFVESVVQVNDEILMNAIRDDTLQEIQQTIMHDLVLAQDPMNGDVRSNIDELNVQIQSSLAAIRTWSIAQAIPILGVVFLIVKSQGSLISMIRRESIMRFRTLGVSKRSILISLIFEAVLIGCFVSLLGSFLAMLLISAITSGNTHQIPHFSTVIVSFFGGISTTMILEWVLFKDTSNIESLAFSPESVNIQEVKSSSFNKNWAVLIIILGTSKMIVWATGFSLEQFIVSGVWPIYLYVLLYIWFGLDVLIGYIGPLLLLIGIALFLSQSGYFERVTVLFDLASSKNKRRRQTKSSSRNESSGGQTIVALFLIIGILTWFSFTYASEVDLATRKWNQQVGADISFNVNQNPNITYIVEKTQSIEGVGRVTMTTNLEANMGTVRIPLFFVDPANWLDVAYFESSWFWNTDLDQLFQNLGDNNSIILEKRVSHELGIKINDVLACNLYNQSVELEVIGFFGPEPRLDTGVYGERIWNSEIAYSFVSFGFLDNMNFNYSSARILIDANHAANTDEIVQQIDELNITDSTIQAINSQNIPPETMLKIKLASFNLVVAYAFSIIASIVVLELLLDSARSELRILFVHGIPLKMKRKLILRDIGPSLLLTPISIFTGILCYTASILWQTQTNPVLVAYRIPEFLIPALSIVVFLASFIFLIFVVSKRL